ncbi:phage holin family protein [Harryflintia acetispora]|uniref:Toxin secretion/phage lysis holin n=1 Tax=Harryflintia acetispora TaxID=1849041 RepID=A0A9X8UHN0_9FIRM|nr:phage holin family protein [Harryflintia acetispora]TCL42414.1 toxin secretion/phage lysis holin [Harryflintia acetispora]
MKVPMGNLFWNYGAKGAEVSAAVAAVGTFLAGILGGWDFMMIALLWAMGLDVLLGLLCAVKVRNVDSQVMLWGGINKVLVLLFVAFGVVMDRALSFDNPYIRTAIICFYLGREGLSIIENSAKLGMPWPGFITALLEQLKERGEKGK